MSWSILAGLPRVLFDANGDPYSGAVLKAYLPGTTTSTSLAIDSAGSSPQTSITYNAEGKLEVSGNENQAYIDRKCKWGIFANATDAAANTPFYMGPFDNVEQTVSREESAFSKSFPTLAAAVADAGLVDGDALNIAERASGNGGGAIWDVVLSSTVTENTYDIVQCTGVATLSLVLRVGQDGTVNNLQFGALPSPTGTPVDINLELNAFFNTARFSNLRVLGNTTGDNLLSSKTIQTGADKTIHWGGVVLQSITGVDLGAVISFATGNVVYKPEVNGGGAALIAGSSGQNGFGAVGDVTIYSPVATDCARGTSTPFDGGKGIQCESDGTDVVIFDMLAENCHMAVSSRKEGAVLDGNHLKVFGLKAKNCNHVSFSGQSNINTLDPAIYSVLLEGVEVEDCGALDALTEANAGLFMFSRAANVTINNVSISGTTKIGGIFRGRTRNSTARNINVTIECDGVYNIDPTVLYADDTNLSEGNNFEFNVHTGAPGVDYLLLSDLTDATHPNRFVDDSNLSYKLKVDVATAIVSPATRNGDCRIDTRLAGKIGNYQAADYNSFIANMAALDSSSEHDYRVGTFSPTFEGSTGTIGTTAYTEQTGSYTLVGDRCFIDGIIVPSDLGSWTGNVRIGLNDLPFTSAGSGFEAQGSVELRSISFTSGASLTVELGRASSSQMEIKESATGAASASVSVSDVTAGDFIGFSISFKIA